VVGKVQDVVGITSTATNAGYWLAGADGGVFALGDAPFEGSSGGMPIGALVVGIAPTQSSQGYWLAQSNGGSLHYGDATDLGNASSLHLNAPMVNEGD
jgi:hypothetical protein